MPQMLTFNDAVSLTNQIINFFNNSQSDPVIDFLSRKFNLDVKENFTVSVQSINRNCHECSGCHGGSCTLGCYISQEKGLAGRLCYWDKALEEVVGTRLVVHEMGHVIYDQIFIDNLSPERSFEQSEIFAQYMENHYDFDMSFSFNGFDSNPIVEKMDFTGVKESGMRIFEAVIVGGIIAIVSVVIAKKVSFKN